MSSSDGECTVLDSDYTPSNIRQSPLALFVPLVAKPDKVEDVSQFVGVGYDLVQAEAETIQWFGVKYSDHTPPTFAIVDTFRTEGGRNAHLTGKVAAALIANAGTLLATGPEITSAGVLANKVKEGSASKTAGLGVGLRVLLTAKPEKVQAVKEFLTGALPLVDAEPETLVWYALEFPGTNNFAIVDFFADEAGRNAHLTGKVAEALFASVDELLTGAPDVVKFDVVAASVKL